MPSRILIIDDDPTFLQLLQNLMEMEGYPAFLLGSGKTTEEVLAHIQLIQPALILCDVCFGEISGLEILRSIRGTPDLNQVRVLMSSGINYQPECVREKADGFILKPYMPDDLLEKIRCILTETNS